MKKRSFIVLFLILLFALFLRLPQILRDQFVFIFDTGRDMLWARNLAVLHKLFLIGPWTALAGIFFGPLWWYLLTVAFVLTGGDPKGGALLSLIFNLATIIAAYFLGKRLKNGRLGIIFSLLCASSAYMINLSTYAFNPNPLPFTTLFFLWSLFEVLQGKEKFFVLASFLTSVSFHFEPATAVFTTLTLFIFLLWQRRLLKRTKILLSGFFSFLLPFIPQIIFELRHQFLQTKALVAYFRGTTERLGGELPLILRISDRSEKFLNLFSFSVIHLSGKWLVFLFLSLIFLILSLILVIAGKKEKNFVKINLLVIFVPFLAYIFLFPPELKFWYLSGLTIPFILLTGLVVYFLWQKNFIFGLFLLTFLVIANTKLFSRIDDFFHPKEVKGSEFLAVQKKVVDWIYKDARGRPFSVFVYTPPIYDFHYQYLFWWYGKKKYDYWPEEYSYLPGKIDYVPFKERYLTMQKAIQGEKPIELFYLIIEPDNIKQRVENWKNTFAESQLLKEEEIGERVIIEKRKKT